MQLARVAAKTDRQGPGQGLLHREALPMVAEKGNAGVSCDARGGARENPRGVRATSARPRRRCARRSARKSARSSSDVGSTPARPRRDTGAMAWRSARKGTRSPSDILRAIKDLHRKANCVLYKFGAVDPFVKSYLLESYCLFLYGCPPWSLSSPSIKLIEIALNKLLRRVWNLPHHSHSGICTLHS